MAVDKTPNGKCHLNEQCSTNKKYYYNERVPSLIHAMVIIVSKSTSWTQHPVNLSSKHWNTCIDSLLILVLAQQPSCRIPDEIIPPEYHPNGKSSHTKVIPQVHPPTVISSHKRSKPKQNHPTGKSYKGNSYHKRLPTEQASHKTILPQQHLAIGKSSYKTIISQDNHTVAMTKKKECQPKLNYDKGSCF